MALTMKSTRVNTFLQGSPVMRPAARAQAKRLPARRVPQDGPQAGHCAICIQWIQLFCFCSADYFFYCRLAAPVKAKYGSDSEFFDLDVSTVFWSIKHVTWHQHVNGIL